MVPPLDKESGFYSRTFVVPGKDGGVASYFRYKSTEPLSHATKFQDALFEQVVPQSRFEDWFVTSDLEDAVVLEALCRPPFEPIEEKSVRLLTLKTVFFLAMTSLKRFGDLQALSVAPSYLDFAPSLAKAFLYPHAGYVPKVPSSTPWPIVLQAFCPPPSGSPTIRGLIVCVQCEHWTRTSTELPCGEGWTNCWYAMIPLRGVFLLPSGPSAGG